METVSPNIFVNDLPATIAFYKLLRFEVITTVPAESGEGDQFALMMNGKTTFMFQTFRSIGETLPFIPRTGGGALLLYVKLTGIRKFYEEIKDKVTLLTGLEKTFYGATEFSLLDNNNFMLTFAEDE
jgi:uncharacterized glyoxalase superfamily protein PhnB